MGETKADSRKRAPSAFAAESIERLIKDAIAATEPQVLYFEGDLRHATGRLLGWHLTENIDLIDGVALAIRQ